ncbi:MAG: hypothetical protein AMK75_04165 [Planctomycetes bacterium SM23_65]|nr:MAG: hypothetical protein AMK75_04165 [Planctomycetes bacterium SM23_65]
MDDAGSSEAFPPALLITGGRVFTPFDAFSPGEVLIRDGKIAAVGKDLSAETPADARRMYAKGLTVAPGFIDLHTQGGCGYDIWMGTREALEGWSRCQARHGVTSFMLTTGYKTAGYDFLTSHLDCAAVAAKPIGVYLESPFCSMEKRGGISEERVGPVSLKLLDEIQSTLDGHLHMMLVAPEREGGVEMIAELDRRGIVPAIGHTNCTYEQAKAAVDAGATHVTHCFNAMRAFHQRDPGSLPLVLTDDRVDIELICDGFHIHPAVIRLAVQLKGTGLTSVVTDNMRVAGMPEGDYTFERMGRTLTVQGGVPRLADGTIAGSTLTMNRALGNVIDFTGLPLKDALVMLTSSPAKAVRLGDRKGELRPGFDADLVLFDENFTVHSTIVEGKTVYVKDAG